MNYLKLAEMIVEYLRGKGITAEIKIITKNNNIKLHAIILQNERDVQPCFFVESIAAEIGQDESVSDYAEYLLSKYESVKELPFDTCCLMDMDFIRQRLSVKVINAEKNREYLSTVPHRLFLDLAVIYQIVVDRSEIGMSTTAVTNEFLNSKMGMSEDELFVLATENLIMQGYEFKPMDQIIREIVGPDVEIDIPDGNTPLYVLRSSQTFGASCIASDVALREVSEKIGSFYIIPSSIHELIVMPEYFVPGVEEMKSMIREVNDTQVAESDMLSYSLYFYSKKEKRLEIAQ